LKIIKAFMKLPKNRTGRLAALKVAAGKSKLTRQPMLSTFNQQL
jgi:hypothetical protein